MDVECFECGEPVGPEPEKNCIGEAIKTPAGLEYLKVYHKRCAPRGLIWSLMEAMWRHN